MSTAEHVEICIVVVIVLKHGEPLVLVVLALNLDEMKVGVVCAALVGEIADKLLLTDQQTVDGVADLFIAKVEETEKVTLCDLSVEVVAGQTHLFIGDGVLNL